MIKDEDERPAKAPTRHQIGEALDTLSVDELANRIHLLRAEIARIEAEIGRKEASRQAADAFFKH